jgi:hypothetical protein
LVHRAAAFPALAAAVLEGLVAVAGAE